MSCRKLLDAVAQMKFNLEKFVEAEEIYAQAIAQEYEKLPAFVFANAAEVKLKLKKIEIG